MQKKMTTSRTGWACAGQGAVRAQSDARRDRREAQGDVRGARADPARQEDQGLRLRPLRGARRRRARHAGARRPRPDRHGQRHAGVAGQAALGPQEEGGGTSQCPTFFYSPTFCFQGWAKVLFETFSPSKNYDICVDLVETN